MGFIYVIKNILNNKIYVGQTTRTIKLRWTEHRNKKNRLLNEDISKFGKDNFIFIFTKEYPNEELEDEEKKLITLHNSLSPNGYNVEYGSNPNLDTKSSSKGGKSETGHDKQSLKVKEKYKNNPKLKDLGDIPRGISFWSGVKNNKQYEGFKVRKIGIKYKEFISSAEKDILKENLKKSIDYLNTYYE